MNLTVGIYAPDTQGNVGKVGELIYDGKSIRANPPDKPLLVKIMNVPIKLLGEPKPISPLKDPEQFMRRLHERYRSPYLTALGVSEKSSPAAKKKA